MQTYARRLALVLAFTLLPLSGCKRTHQIIHHATSSEPDYTPQILADITPGHIDGMKYPDFTDIQAQVNNLYDMRDVDALYEELKPKLDTMPKGDVHGPADKPYHERELLILGPDGDLVCFGQRL